MITVIIPTKNSAATIELTLQSLMLQTLKNFELIIVDKSSSDTTKELVKHYFSDAKIIQQENRGIWDAINIGIRNASGRIIHVLNSDDFISAKVLEEVLQTFEKNKMISAVWIPTYSSAGYLNKLSPEKIWLGMHKFAPGHSASFFVKKEIHSELGLYDTRTVYCADHELFWKIIRANKTTKIINNTSEFGVFTYGGFSSTNPYKKKLREEVDFRRTGLFRNKRDTYFILIIWPMKEIWNIIKPVLKWISLKR